MKKIVLSIFTLAVLSFITSCTKDEPKTNETEVDITEMNANKTIVHNVYYKGEKFVLEGQRDFENKVVDWKNIPDQLKNWNKSGEENVVSHVLLYNDHTDVYLFDNEEEHQNLFTFESGGQNRLKSSNEVGLKTYMDIANPAPNQTVYGNVLRQIWSSYWGLRCFGNFWSYGDGTAWVGDVENDNISGIRLDWTIGTPRAQFVCCQDANWGGARLYITRMSNSSSPSYANMFDYTFTYIWKRNWNDVISSYELFQSNVFLSGQQI